MTPEHLAAHEAGHAVVAWHNGLIDSVRAEITPVGGVVLYKADWECKGSRRGVWTNLVISVAGIAGEFRCGYRVRSRGAVNDLVDARALARQLTHITDVERAFPVDTTERQQIARMFAEAPTEAERHVLEAAYLKARTLLRFYAPEFALLAFTLALFESLDTRELALLLGRRPTEKRFVLMRRPRVLGWLLVVPRYVVFAWWRLLRGLYRWCRARRA